MQSAIVIGATKRFCKAIALILIKHNYDPVIEDRSIQHLEKMKNEIEHKLCEMTFN